VTTEARPEGRVRSGAAWSLVYLGAVRLGSFGLSVVVARLLGPAGSGAFGIALQVSALANFAGGLNTNQALTQKLAAHPSPAWRARLMDAALRILLAGSLATGLATSLAAPFLAERLYHDANLRTTLVWCGPLAVGSALFLWAEGAFQGLARFRALAGWGSAIAISDLALGIPAALLGLPGIYAVRTAVRVVAGLVGGRWCARRATEDTGPLVAATAPPTASSGPTLREAARLLLSFGAPSMLASALFVLGQTVLRLLLVRGSGLGAAGQFQVADTIGQGLLAVPMAAAAAFLPAVARDRATGSPFLATSLGRAARLVCGFNLPLCLGAIALGPLFARWIFGGEFAAAARSLQLLTYAYALGSLTVVIGAAVLGRGEVGTSMLLTASWLVTLTITLALGGAARGAEGAALSMTVAYVAVLVGSLVVAVGRWRVPFALLGAPVATTLLAPLAALAVVRFIALPGWLGAGLVLLLALAIFRVWAWPDAVLFVRRR